MGLVKKVFSLEMVRGYVYFHEFLQNRPLMFNKWTVFVKWKYAYIMQNLKGIFKRLVREARFFFFSVDCTEVSQLEALWLYLPFYHVTIDNSLPRASAVEASTAGKRGMGEIIDGTHGLLLCSVWLHARLVGMCVALMIVMIIMSILPRLSNVEKKREREGCCPYQQVGHRYHTMTNSSCNYNNYNNMTIMM